MREPLRYLRFDTSAFLNDEHVVKMNAAERGLYISALCWAWHEGSIPDDADELASLLRLRRSDVVRAFPRVRERFKPTGKGRLIHERLEADRAEAFERRQIAIKSGRQGGKVSAAKRKRGGGDDTEPEGCLEGSSSKSLEGRSTSLHHHTLPYSTSSSSSASPGDDADNLTRRLTERGVTPPIARDLVKRFPDRVRQQLDWFPQRLNVDNPGAYLAEAIRDNFGPPTDRKRRQRGGTRREHQDIGDLPPPREPEAYRTVMIAGELKTFTTGIEARAAEMADRRRQLPGAGNVADS